MLTKQDLQQIKQVVRGEVTGRFDNLDKRVGEVETGIGSLRSEMKAGFRKIRKDLKQGVNFLDKEILSDRKRLNRIERHLELPPHA